LHKQLQAGILAGSKQGKTMPSADLIITNARLLTMHKPAMRAESIGLKGNRIVAVGSNADVKALKDKHTRVVDAQMNTVMPGVIESHIHLLVELASLMINNIKGLSAVSDSIREYAKANPKDRIIMARLTFRLATMFRSPAKPWIPSSRIAPWLSSVSIITPCGPTRRHSRLRELSTAAIYRPAMKL
jgi:hypothetical protein